MYTDVSVVMLSEAKPFVVKAACMESTSEAERLYVRSQIPFEQRRHVPQELIKNYFHAECILVTLVLYINPN